MSDINKLPKWAQDKIRVLEENVAHWRDKALARVGEGPTNTWVEGGASDADNIPLPNGAQVRFRLDNGHTVVVGVARSNVNGAKGFLHLNASRSLAVRPRATNAIVVEVDDA